MKYVLVLALTLFSLPAFAGGKSCNRELFRHFLSEGRRVLDIEEPAEFKKHWEGFVNRSNTEWLEELQACGYNPEQLKSSLWLARESIDFEAFERCQKDAGEFRQKDYDKCRADRNKVGQTFKECLDRADSVFRDHLMSCAVKDTLGPRERPIPDGGGKCDKGGACNL